jgi:hypothetical protein
MSELTSLRARFNNAYARWAPEPLKRARGSHMAREIDLARARLLRDADAERLLDPGYLEHDLIPALGLNDDQPQLYPPELRERAGDGLRSWQYPNQLAPYLVEIARRGVRRYLEIGVEHGGTFVLTTEYLRRFAELDLALAVDVIDVPSVRRLAAERPGVRFLRSNSRSRGFRRLLDEEPDFDLVLIDGDHVYEAVRADWETVRAHARMVAFHDIVDADSPGVAQLWSELREQHGGEYELLEFTAQYDEVVARTGGTRLGIGLAVKR